MAKKPASTQRPDPRIESLDVPSPVKVLDPKPSMAELVQCGVCNGWSEQMIADAVTKLRASQPKE